MLWKQMKVKKITIQQSTRYLCDIFILASKTVNIQMNIMYKCTLCIWLYTSDANQPRKWMQGREQRVCEI
jgi:hypothetical protein